MNTETIIREIVNRAIPLHPTCAIERTKEMERRARLRIDIEELVRKPKPYDPRTDLKVAINGIELK
jgi:hypothetical protein